MPSIRMITNGEPGFDLHGPVSAGDGLQPVARLDAWSDVALAPHLQGYMQARRNADANHSRRINEAARLVSDIAARRIEPFFLQVAMNPHRSSPLFVEHLRQTYPNIFKINGRMLGLRETMAPSDYQALYADVIDRAYYAQLTNYPITNMGLVVKKTLRDFRYVKRYLTDNLSTPFTGTLPGGPAGQSAYLGPTPQNGPSPPTASTSTAAIEYQPWLFQSGASVSWDAFLGDDLGMFQKLPQSLAIKAARGTAKFITGMYADINGPNTSGAYVGVPGAPASSVPLFKSGFNNILSMANGASSTNPRLNIQSIVDCYNILAGQVDSTGDPIMMAGPANLVYGRFDYGTAKQLANMLENMTQVQGGVPGTSSSAPIGQMIRVRNWAMENLTLVYDPYLSIVASNKPFTWFMALEAGSQERPGIEFGTLAGFEDAPLFSEIPTTQRMGGGPDPAMGNFWTNNQNLKIMKVMGATAIEGRSWVGSDGSGS